MHDFSKYNLKDKEELSELLAGRDYFFILACNKCFTALDAQSIDSPVPEVPVLSEFIDSLGKKIAGIISTDFLCIPNQLKKILTSLSAAFDEVPSPHTVLAIACGIGTQAVAGELFERSPAISVYTVCDSAGSGSSHGMALGGKLCAACTQCFLNKTGGICPVTGCFKGLLNGPCGGAKDGKCEADSGLKCVWEEIFRLSAQKSPDKQDISYDNSASLPAPGEKADSLTRDNGISVLDCSRIKRSDLSALAGSVRAKRAESFTGGLYLEYSKDCTAFLTLKEFPVPRKVVIPMSQHAGMSAVPIVRSGERVLVGQKIGEAVGTLSSSVHASISGVVREIATRSHPNSIDDMLCITIESDGKDELHRSVLPIPYWEDLDIFDIDAIIAEKGIVGMGGAGFPTPVKLKAPKPIDTILLNGCESEPYITADHRVMLEKADNIIAGLQIMMKSTGARRGIIVISDNKSDAIAHLEAKTAVFDDIFVMPLWSKYPQGAERMLILRALGRHLDYGQRPYDAGAIVINVSTASAIGDAFTRGMPLISRAVTVSGERVKRPGNFMVRIGTSVSDILGYCGFDGTDTVVRLGGPMMGTELDDLEVPVIKGSNGIIATERVLKYSGDCIRCGRCVEVCPMELLPLYFPPQLDLQASGGGHAAPADPSCAAASPRAEINAVNCIECGACDYICPSGIKIRDAVRTLKRALR